MTYHLEYLKSVLKRLSEEEKCEGIKFFGAGGGGDACLGKGFRRNVEGLERGLKLLAALGEGGFYDLLGVGPDLLVWPGDGADFEYGGVDVGPGVEVVLFDGGEALGWA